jgi:hypothetical protein
MDGVEATVVFYASMTNSDWGKAVSFECSDESRENDLECNLYQRLQESKINYCRERVKRMILRWGCELAGRSRSGGNFFEYL